jgi:hypothetical protein
MKNLNDTIGNQTRDLPARSAVLQTTEPPCGAPPMMVLLLFIITAFRTQNYTNQILPCVKDFLNLLAPELFILILAHPVYKM